MLLAAFVVVELRSRRPMFDLGLFRKPAFVGVSLATFAIGAGMFAMYPYLTLYLQNDLGYSPLAGGARLLPVDRALLRRPAGDAFDGRALPPRNRARRRMAITALGLAAMYGLSAARHGLR